MSIEWDSSFFGIQVFSIIFMKDGRQICADAVTKTIKKTEYGTEALWN